MINLFHKEGLGLGRMPNIESKKTSYKIEVKIDIDLHMTLIMQIDGKLFTYMSTPFCWS